MRVLNIRTMVFGAALALVLSGCQNARLSPYRMPIDQGQRIESTALARVAVGMSKQQVLQILGEPLLRDIFHASRWDYPVQLEPGRADTKSVSIMFDGDQVSKVLQ